MKTLGLTGGIGMGKSACAQLCRLRGLPVVDTDELAREVVEPGQPALEELRRIFGPEVIGPEGRLLREVLARRVFADPAARQQLEAILHPPIRQLWRTRLQRAASQGHLVGVVVIPLLFETRAETELDATLCVACSVRTQNRRLQGRGWSAEQIQQRIQAQLPVETKMARADFVIWSEGTLELHAAQLDRILKHFEGGGRRAEGGVSS